MRPNATTFVCEACTRCNTQPEIDRAVAVALARRAGWTIDYHGPGHGSLAWCPSHAELALKAAIKPERNDK